MRSNWSSPARLARYWTAIVAAASMTANARPTYGLNRGLAGPGRAPSPSPEDVGARTAVDVSLEVSPLPLRHRQEGSYAVAADLVKRTPAPEDSRALGLVSRPGRPAR